MFTRISSSSSTGAGMMLLTPARLLSSHQSVGWSALSVCLQEALGYRHIMLAIADSKKYLTDASKQVACLLAV